MIPFIKYETIELGFFSAGGGSAFGGSIQVWGLAVALGFLAGLWLTYARAKKIPLSPPFSKGEVKGDLATEKIFSLAFWIIISALVGARFFHVFFYQWSYFSTHLLDIFKFWQGGFASYGGFIGAFLAGVIYIKIHKFNFWQYADLVIFSLPLGLFIGRLGCFLVQDHPGIRTNFFLAVNYPDGPRHDLGLYLSLNALVLFLVFLILNRRPRFTGFYTTFFAIWYGLTRFALDFLRAWDLPISDARYFYLTPAQYGSIILLILGVWFWVRLSAVSRDLVVPGQTKV